MRLCLVSLDFAPVRTSGLTIYAERLARLLANHGHQVTVVAARRPGLAHRTFVEDIVVDRLPIGRSDWIGYGLRAARHVARRRARGELDLVHFLDVHFAWAYHGPFVASLLQSFRQRLTADGGRPYASSWPNRVFRRGYYSGALRWMERPALRRAGALVSLSEATRQEFIQHYRIRPERIMLTPPSIDPTRFAPPPPEAVAALRRRLGLEGRRVLLHVGFSTPRKGLEYLVAALPALPADVRLVLVGAWEPGYREKVRAAAGAAWERVLEAGSVPDAEMPLYFALADTLTLPSLLEGFGLPALEAMACGTPVIAAASGALPEVVGPCGVLVPPRDTPALVAAIRALLDDEPRRARLARCGRERACTVFSPEREYATVMQAYRRMMDVV
ncbi:MAG: glycosyltransferase family 4 protein [Oscillochloridaceae bacterium]|nr:glycosyltransferase family 4 protein [Chloroflexaceae bacterium]MDW8389407.1 glycosyltransferase family 4 protein [Oscillochloridaceae bacterium]